MNKTILITGATGGVGEATVKLLTDQHCVVIALGRDAKKLKQLEKTINSNLLYTYKIDIKNHKSIKKTFEEIRKNFTRINVLINNASIFKSKSFLDYSTKEINDIIDTNLKGTIHCTMECLKSMIENGGRIINISSVSGTHGIANQTIYSASKFAINGFSEALNQELISKNIKITTICPGGINTPLWNENNPYNGNVEDLLKPIDIANCISYITTLSDNVVLKTLTLFPTCEWH